MSDPISVDVNGVIANDQSSQIQSLYPGHTFTPTANFSFVWNNAILSFTFGDSVETTPDLLAALTAAGAPITTP